VKEARRIGEVNETGTEKIEAGIEVIERFRRE
jgi:hypothetical protein